MRDRSIITVAAALLSVIIGATLAGVTEFHRTTPESEQRFSKAVIEEVSFEYNMVTFLDEGGDLWVAEVDSTDGFVEGDKYILTFDDMGTSDPYDDELIDIF